MTESKQGNVNLPSVLKGDYQARSLALPSFDADVKLEQVTLFKRSINFI